MTLNPYLGWDSLEPFFRVALEQNKGVFVCAQTSNPGARDLQSALVGAKTVYQLVAEHVSARDDSHEPSLGVVVGATFPETAAELRKLGARCWFLVPGIGAQGGSLDTIDRFFRPDGLGALLSSSRSVIFPHRFGNVNEWSEQGVRDAAQALIVAIQNGAIKPRN
jgi:orotidine-5'-phosphate decarboxylase